MLEALRLVGLTFIPFALHNIILATMMSKRGEKYAENASATWKMARSMIILSIDEEIVSNAGTLCSVEDYFRGEQVQGRWLYTRAASQSCSPDCENNTATGRRAWREFSEHDHDRLNKLEEKFNNRQEEISARGQKEQHLGQEGQQELAGVDLHGTSRDIAIDWQRSIFSVSENGTTVYYKMMRQQQDHKVYFQDVHEHEERERASERGRASDSGGGSEDPATGCSSSAASDGAAWVVDLTLNFEVEAEQFSSYMQTETQFAD